MSAEDDTYSTIFTALKHPIRRNILRRLSTSPATYTELLKELDIETGLLTYHLDSMRELLKKKEDGSYTLSEYGRAGLNLIQKVEEPKAKPVALFGLNANQLKAVFLILLISLGTVSSYLAYTQLQPKPEAPVTGVVARLYEAKYSGETLLGYTGVIRLLPIPKTGNSAASLIRDYFIKTNGLTLQQGYLVTGYLTSTDQIPTFEVQSGSPFLTSFVGQGTYVSVSHIRLSTGFQYPELVIEFSNLGDKHIVSMRCWANGTLLPFTFGVSEANPIQPSTDFSGSVSTSWTDPVSGQRQGLTPTVGNSYPIHLKLVYSDGSIDTIDRSLRAEGGGSVEWTVGDTGVDHLAIDLLEVNAGKSLLSVEFKSIWIKPVAKAEVLVDSKIVITTPLSLKYAQYWIGSINVPFSVYTGSVNNVTLRLTAKDGEVFSTSRLVTCQHQ